MQHRPIALLIGLAGVVVGTCDGQTAPVKPHLIMWPGSANVTGSIAPAPSNAIPITRDDWNAIHLNALKNASDAADWAFDQLVADATPASGATDAWIDEADLALFPRYLGEDLFASWASTSHPPHPDTDPATQRGSTTWNHDWSFFRPNDRLMGLFDVLQDPPQGVFFPGDTEAQERSYLDRNNVTWYYYDPG